MKKIAILSAVNIKHMSLISLYTSYLEKNGIPYDIIYMDKYDEEETIGANNIFRFVNPIDSKWGRTKKILTYFRFFSYARDILEKRDYDFIIVWNDIAISMFGLYLAKQWKNKYCLNCRDYNGEKKWYVFHIFKKAIYNAAFTTISSEGFRSFLPKHDYISLYSYNKELLELCEPRESKQNLDKPIRISFIGNVRFFDENKKIVNLLKNDKRFELHFHGTNAEIMEEYAKSIGAKNVVCSGRFPVQETPKYLEQADIINNVFGIKTIGVRTLTSIRLFHAAYMNIPILVSQGSFMEEISTKFGIGFSVKEEDQDLGNELYSWYTNLNFCQIKDGGKALIDEAIFANTKFELELKKWIG